MNNEERCGKFTSSRIHLLMVNGRGALGFGAGALTYIKQKRAERRLGKCFGIGAYSQAMAWGNFMEFVIFNHLGMEYQISSKQSVCHTDPDLEDYWAGSCDLEVISPQGEWVAELKCYQLENFCAYTDAILKQDLEYLKKEFAQEYWQIVSNAIIHCVDYGEAISFAPYESEMVDIRQLASDYEGEDKWKYRFIYEKPLDELACIPDGGYYQNANQWKFKIPKEDIKALTERVKLAITLLNSDTPI